MGKLKKNEVKDYLLYKSNKVLKHTTMQTQDNVNTHNETTSWADNTVEGEATVNLTVGTEYVARVKWFNNTKGYGFITVLDNETDLFVHHSEIKPHTQCWRTLMTGEYVQVTVGQDNQGKFCGLNVTGIQGGQLMCEHMTPYMANRFQKQQQRTNTNNVTTDTVEHVQQ